MGPAMSAAEGVSKSFRPPKWCRAPKDPAARRQVLSFAREDGSGQATPQPVLEVSEKAVYTIGRGDSSDVRLRGDLASRLHAALLQDAEGRKFLVDLRSTHGTFLGGKRLAPHEPARWTDGLAASFGSGPKAENLVLSPTPNGAGGEPAVAPAKRRRRDSRTSSSGGSGNGSEAAEAIEPLSLGGAEAGSLASLYDGLPEAAKTECTPRAEVGAKAMRLEPLPPPEDNPTKVLFLDVDGVLRPVHGRQDAFQHARTIEINGSRVPLLGNSEAKAGIDFWPTAMRALRHIVQRTGARLVLSSDWRKEAVLKQGIAGALEEYRMPALYGETPDMDQATRGVIKALHTSFREKRCKEIRKWLSRYPKIQRWIAIDDVDLSLPDKEAKRELEADATQASVFLNPSENFVRTNPQSGLNMELARLAVCLLNGQEVTQDVLDAAYGAPD